MTADEMAAILAAAFEGERAWSAQECAALLEHPLTHLSAVPHGFALWRSVARETELLTLAVHPDHHAQGIGAALMRVWMTQAAHHSDTAFLEVALDNDKACALYHRFGFDVVARRAGYYKRGATQVDALIMRAALACETD